MKIAVAPADYFGCGWYRMVLPYLALRDRGHEVSFIDEPLRGLNDRVQMALTLADTDEVKRAAPLLIRAADPRIAQADALVVQRTPNPKILALIEAMKAAYGLRVIYEFDDNLHAFPTSHPFAHVYGNGKPGTRAMEGFLQIADVVTTSTAALADEYRRFSSEIHVCENALADEHVERHRPQIVPGVKREGQVRIGWAGSDTHGPDFSLVVKPLSAVLREVPRARFILAGADFRPMFPRELWPRIDYVGSTFDRTKFYASEIEGGDVGILPAVRYYDLLAKMDLDIALAPIVATTFNRCKSYLKVMEYGMLGIPAIASAFGPYRQYQAEAPEPVIVTADGRDWARAIRDLIASPERRVALARANRAYVERSHRMSVKVNRWETALARVGRSAAA